MPRSTTPSKQPGIHSQSAGPAAANEQGAGQPTAGAGEARPTIAEQGFRVSAERRIAIEGVQPELDGGRWPVKREVGDTLEVSADIFRDSSDLLGAALRYRVQGEQAWQEAPMTLLDNDRWGGSFLLETLGRYEYGVLAWTDDFATWRRDMLRRLEVGQDVHSEYLQGVKLIEEALARATPAQRAEIEPHLKGVLDAADPSEGSRLATAGELSELLRPLADRSAQTRYDRVLEVVVDRVRARFAAWYELFPRSYGKAGAHGTFRDVIGELPRIAGMGFDTLYLTPIHPIGRINRKGRNNALVAEPDDVGSPYGIGSDEGGHTAIHPELGSLGDFHALRDAAAGYGLEIALDIAIQAAPNHPWVKEHPGYFHILPDGHIKYAENPPKKYEDIYPINFYGAEAESLWLELEEMFEYWIDQGVLAYRIDNPHTKSLDFWAWLIPRLKARHPGVILLAEAFTRPKVMRRLAKVGFTQSYTYFTWRNNKAELTEYLTELSQSEMREYYRGSLWPNTHDILHEYLVHGGLPAFRIRLTLAATLSSVYGIYSGYEVGDNEPHPGKEEYTNNEKYQLRQYDWNAPGNLTEYITRINAIRREHPALQEYDNLHFIETSSDQILAYTKRSGDDTIVCVVTLDPQQVQEGWVRLPLWELGVSYESPYTVVDLLTGASYGWQGEWNYVRFDPHYQVAHVFELKGTR